MGIPHRPVTLMLTIFAICTGENSPFLAYISCNKSHHWLNEDTLSHGQCYTRAWELTPSAETGKDGWSLVPDFYTYLAEVLSRIFLFFHLITHPNLSKFSYISRIKSYLTLLLTFQCRVQKTSEPPGWNTLGSLKSHLSHCDLTLTVKTPLRPSGVRACLLV